MGWFKDKPDTRKPITMHDFFQDQFGWRLEVHLYVPSRGEFGPSWKRVITLHRTWGHLPSETLIDSEILNLTDDIWVAYRVYKHANERGV